MIVLFLDLNRPINFQHKVSLGSKDCYNGQYKSNPKAYKFHLKSEAKNTASCSSNNIKAYDKQTQAQFS